MTLETDYLQAILATLGRSAFPPEVLVKLVSPKGDGKKQIAAFNLCDGQHTQTQIAAAVALDKANLNKSIARWIELGIAARIGDLPVHIYRLPDTQIAKAPRKNGN